MSHEDKFYTAVNSIRSTVMLSNSNVRLKGNRVAYLDDHGNCIVVRNTTTGSLSILDRDTADVAVLDEIIKAYTGLRLISRDEALTRALQAYVETMTDAHDCNMLLELVMSCKTNDSLEAAIRDRLQNGYRGFKDE